MNFPINQNMPLSVKMDTTDLLSMPLTGKESRTLEKFSNAYPAMLVMYSTDQDGEIHIEMSNDDNGENFDHKKVFPITANVPFEKIINKGRAWVRFTIINNSELAQSKCRLYVESGFFTPDALDLSMGGTVENPMVVTVASPLNVNMEPIVVSVPPIEVNVPEIVAPDIVIPPIELPEITLPALPTINLPTINLPTINLPNVICSYGKVNSTTPKTIYNGSCIFYGFYVATAINGKAFTIYDNTSAVANDKFATITSSEGVLTRPANHGYIGNPVQFNNGIHVVSDSAQEILIFYKTS